MPYFYSLACCWACWYIVTIELSTEFFDTHITTKIAWQSKKNAHIPSFFLEFCVHFLEKKWSLKIQNKLLYIFTNWMKYFLVLNLFPKLNIHQNFLIVFALTYVVWSKQDLPENADNFQSFPTSWFYIHRVRSSFMYRNTDFLHRQVS